MTAEWPENLPAFHKPKPEERVVISDARINSLRAQAACSHGFAPPTLHRLKKEGQAQPAGLGPMVVITLGELRVFMDAYDATHRGSMGRDEAVWRLIDMAEKCGATPDEGEQGGVYWTFNLSTFYALEAKLHR